MTLTQITEKGIKDGEIIDADINTNAGILGSKVSPNFGSQDISTTGNASVAALNLIDNSPSLIFTDSAANSDFRIRVQSGILKLRDDTNSADRLTIDSSGRVGIGLQNPQSLLELNAANDVVTGIQLGRAGDAITASRYIGICQTNNATNLATNSGFSGIEFGGPSSTREAYLAFHTHDAGVGSGERMCIDKSGQVGIGTASPDRLIHGYGATPILKLDSTNNEAYVQFTTASPSNTFYIGLVDSDIILQSSGASSTTSENLRIKANGRVGINSASPSGTLSVADPNGDNVTLVLHTSATANYIQLSDSQNAHSYIAKENNGNLSQVAFYASTSTGNGTGKVGHFDYRGLVLPAGKAISFSPHDDPYSSSSNSNRLEDYEEGNFTPTITATGNDPTQSYTTQLGYYVKVGRIVTIAVDVIFASSGISGGTGEAVLSNLPFVKQNSTQHYGCTMAVGYSPNWSGNGAPTGGYINPNSTFAYLMPYNSNGVTFTMASEVGNQTRLIAGFTYMTNS